MIVTFLCSVILGLVQGLFSLLPTWGVDTSSLTGAQSIAVSAGSLDGWIPETFIFGCLAVVVAARLWFLVINGFQWLYHLVPFNGGS